MSEEQSPDQPEQQKVPWYVRDEADRTLRLLGGLIIFTIALIGVFYLEASHGGNTKKYLTPELIHSIFIAIGGWVVATSMSGQRKTNNNENGGGRKPYVP